MKLELIAHHGLPFFDSPDAVLLATGCRQHIILAKCTPSDPHLVVFTRRAPRFYAAKPGGM